MYLLNPSAHTSFGLEKTKPLYHHLPYVIWVQGGRYIMWYINTHVNGEVNLTN